MSESATHGHTMEKTYYKVFFGLLVFTVVTFLVAENFQNKTAKIFAAMTIASVKASLVAMYFMHLKFEGRWKWVLLAPTVVLAIVMICALLPDIAKLGPWKLS